MWLLCFGGALVVTGKKNGTRSGPDQMEGAKHAELDETEVSQAPSEVEMGDVHSGDAAVGEEETERVPDSEDGELGTEAE